MKRLPLLLILALSLLVPTLAPTIQAQRVSYGTLTEGQTLSGFRTGTVYLNDADRPMGARFVHQKSGFTLDLLEIQSVPQAFVWVTTYPTSDKGEPHTQEHLLLGKGNKGRSVASHEALSLAASTAFTSQWRTCYSFYTSAGVDVFYDELERRMDAMLHPDYSDEEIRREVRNFGIAEAGSTRTLSLEEKGSVYNEMVSTTDQPARRLETVALNLIYGANHPLQFNSGGSPEALRQLSPADIRTFHGAHYFLGNMGAIVSVPQEVSIDSVLQKIDALLNRTEPQRSSLPVVTSKDLPAPKPGTPGEIRFVEYPHRNDQQPGSVYLTWPAERTLDLTEQTLFNLFLDAFAGDPTTNLYKRLIDSKTRETNLGAQSVFTALFTDQGFPAIIGFGDVPVAKMNPQDMADLRARVIDEFSRVAAWPNGSADLKAFNDRVQSRVTSQRRELAKFVNSPPGFGFRATFDGWITQLDDVNKQGGFRRSVTMKPVLDGIERMLASPNNMWTARVASWKVTSSQPWVIAAKPNTELAARQQQERADRVAAEVARLKTQYGVATDQDALGRYRADYDRATAAIDQEAARVTPPRFVDNPPLTLDDQLVYRTTELAGGVPMVASTFDSMTSATAGIAFRLDGVPQDRLVYLSMLPQLLTGVGVIDNGRPVSFQEMSERLRQEILSLNADFSTNAKSERVELTVRGAGNDAAESQRAIAWMQLALFHPDWRPENLPRIRDLVDQVLNGLRRTPQTAEEFWVRPVSNAYWRQSNPLFLTTTSFMTQTHNIYRLRWMLKEATPAQRTTTAAALNELANTKGTRVELKAKLAELQAGPNALLTDAAKDIDVTLVDIPDGSLEIDWPRLCREMAGDLTTGPESTLAMLDALRKEILKTGNARLFLIGAASMQQTLASPIGSMVGALDRAPVTRAKYDTVKLVDARLRERDATAVNPVYVGLLNPNSQSGVFLNSAPATSFQDTDREKLLDYLSTNLYGGSGGHGIFSKTIGAGLAYSNGLGDSLSLGRITYYAERTPDLPQTMQFVIEQLKSNQKPDPALVEYAIAQAFLGTRSASSYETRGEVMAQNLVDGMTPEVVTRFHRQILELRGVGGSLADELFRRKDAISSRALPGFGAKKATIDDAVYFVIGPEKQFASWEQYLKSVEGQDVRVHRLYPRDFWLLAAAR